MWRRAPGKGECCFGLWAGRRRRRDVALSFPPWSLSSMCPFWPFSPFCGTTPTISALNAQQAIAEGQRLSWLSEKRLLSQRLERLQRAVARLDREKTELKQYSAELRRTLEEVDQAFAASAQHHGPLEGTAFPEAALWSPRLVSFPLPLSPVATRFCLFSLFWHPVAFANARSLRYQPSCPSVPIHTHWTLLCQELFPPARSLPWAAWSAFWPQRSVVQFTVSEQPSPCQDAQRSFCSLCGVRFL